MQYMTLSPHECLVLGDHITVTVVEVRGDQVRLGIEDTQSFPRYREVVVNLPGGDEWLDHVADDDVTAAADEPAVFSF